VTDLGNHQEEHRVLERFGTGLQMTRVTALPDGRIHWQRTPGSSHPGTYPPVRSGFVRRLRTASSPHIRFAAPSVSQAGEYRWEVAGRNSLGNLVLAEDVPTVRLQEIISHLGGRLRVLHDQQDSADPPGHYPPPPGPARLMAWLDSGRAPRAGAGFHYRLRTQLGASRWEKLRVFTHHMLSPGPKDRTTVVHGWFSLGSVIAADAPDTRPGAVVLSGVEAAQGRPETDLACLIGELTEYALAAERRRMELPVLDSLRDRLLSHYGPTWDRDTLAAGAVVRIATHAHDFAAYVGWNPQLHGYIPMLADLLDIDGMSALPTA